MARLDWSEWNDWRRESKSEVWGERISVAGLIAVITYTLGRLWGWW